MGALVCLAALLVCGAVGGFVGGQFERRNARRWQRVARGWETTCVTALAAAEGWRDNARRLEAEAKRWRQMYGGIDGPPSEMAERDKKRSN